MLTHTCFLESRAPIIAFQTITTNMAAQNTQSTHFSFESSKFVFPKAFFFEDYQLPNSLHPWYNVYVVDVNARVTYRNSSRHIVYPDVLGELEDMRELDREHILADCKTRYDELSFQRAVGELAARCRGKLFIRKCSL